jgi:hypothetical protein
VVVVVAGRPPLFPEEEEEEGVASRFGSKLGATRMSIFCRVSTFPFPFSFPFPFAAASEVDMSSTRRICVGSAGGKQWGSLRAQSTILCSSLGRATRSASVCGLRNLSTGSRISALIFSATMCRATRSSTRTPCPRDAVARALRAATLTRCPKRSLYAGGGGVLEFSAGIVLDCTTREWERDGLGRLSAGEVVVLLEISAGEVVVVLEISAGFVVDIEIKISSSGGGVLEIFVLEIFVVEIFVLEIFVLLFSSPPRLL